MQDQQTRPEKPLDSPRGVYLPLWTFDLGGEIDYVGETIDQEDLQFGRKHPRMVRVTGSYPVQVNDIPIPASRKLSAVFLRLIPTFVLKGVKPFDPRYLASWPAEVYDIPLAEASLDARAQSLSRYKRNLPGLLDCIRIVSTSSANMTVESFRHNLLPVWVTEILFGGREHLVLVNGQNGIVASDLRRALHQHRAAGAERRRSGGHADHAGSRPAPRGGRARPRHGRRPGDRRHGRARRRAGAWAFARRRVASRRSAHLRRRRLRFGLYSSGALYYGGFSHADDISPNLNVYAFTLGPEAWLNAARAELAMRQNGINPRDMMKLYLEQTR